jgi:carbon monoxide dehydrogenase subunit G
MEIESAFEVAAPPDRVFAFLLDINQVVGCMPGAELSEVVDAETFKGRVKVKVGPIAVSYNGVARIASRDEAAHTATLEAEGRETTGPGSARATARMAVVEAATGSKVTISAEYSVAGRVAQFGRGVMEDVARRLLGQMADCIKSRLESADAGTTRLQAPSSEAGTAPLQPPPTAREEEPARPVNALGLLFSVLWARIRGLFRRRGAPA